MACTRVSTIDSEHNSLGYTLYSTYLIISRGNIYNSWLEYRSDKGAMVAVWRSGHLKSTCMHELVTQCSVDAIDAQIGFALGNSVTEPVSVDRHLRLFAAKCMYMFVPW